MSEYGENKKASPLDDDIARMRDDFKIGRFTLDFEGMDTMSVKERVEFVRHGLCADRAKLPENANRTVNEIIRESDARDFFPNVHFIVEKMTKSADKRYLRAKDAYTLARGGSDIRPGKKALGVRRTVNGRYEEDIKNRLLGERKKIDAQKKELEQYLKMAKDSSYAALVNNILKQNEENYTIAKDYLSAKATLDKYETYEKLGVLVEEEKKLCILAKEAEEAARLRLDNRKEGLYILCERDAARLDNKNLIKEAHGGFLNTAKGTLAFIAVPAEIKERLLEYGLYEKESKYYDALRAKEELKGFHPFKKMALSREIAKVAKEYNKGLELLADTKENKLKHQPLTTLKEWENKNLIPEEKIAEDIEDLTPKIEVEVIKEEPTEAVTKSLDLGAKIHTNKAPERVTFEKTEEKETPELDKEIL